ncbi:MAG: hypothetical protein ACT6RD_00905 [Brevundimonas sp.]|uniref:hypothetical protein n=1 Tax=Brevundimonas sp. TaxID=1871086 RepID=UPI004033B75B
MSLDFLTPRVERLSAGGGWTVEHPGGSIGRLRTPVVLLARDLTTFSRFETAGLPRSRRRQAARLHARAASPYLDGASLLVPAGQDFGVWWWDAERVSALVQARWASVRPSIRPETLAQPPAADWRIVALAEGYEAQYWRGGSLHASAWRRERFDIAAWTAFTRAQRDAVDAPETPPAPQRLPLDTDGPAFAVSTAEITREQMIGAGGVLVAMVAVCAALFLTGQGLRLKSDAEALEAETARLQAASPGGVSLADLEGDRRTLAAYRQIEERTSPLSSAGAAIGILAYRDLTPRSLDASDEGLTVTLPYTALSQADDLIADFAESGYFYDIQPRTDAANQTLIIEMRVREAAPPLGSGG